MFQTGSGPLESAALPAFKLASGLETDRLLLKAAVACGAQAEVDPRPELLPALILSNGLASPRRHGSVTVNLANKMQNKTK